MSHRLSPIALAMLAVSGIARAGGYYFRLPVPVPYVQHTTTTTTTSDGSSSSSSSSSSGSGSGSGTGSTAPTSSSGSGGCAGGSVTIQGSASAAVDKTVSIPDNCTTIDVKVYSGGGTSGYTGAAGDTFGPHLYQNAGGQPVYIGNNGRYIQKTNLTSVDGISVIKSGSPGAGGPGGAGGAGSEVSLSLPVASYTSGNTSASSSVNFTAYIGAPASYGEQSTTALMGPGNNYEGVRSGYSGAVGGAGGMAGGKAESDGQYFTFNGGNGSSSYNGLIGNVGTGGACGVKASYTSSGLPNAQDVTFTACTGGLGGNGTNATTSQVVAGQPGKIVVSWN